MKIELFFFIYLIFLINEMSNQKTAIFREKVERILDELGIKGRFVNSRAFDAAYLEIEGFPMGIDIVGDLVILDRGSAFDTVYEPDDADMLTLVTKRITEFL